MKAIKVLVVLAVVLVGVSPIHAANIDWASTVLNSNLPSGWPAENALGQPDNLLAAFYDANGDTIETATFSGFGAGANSSYDSGVFASFLGTTEGILAQADFFTMEFNGTGGGLFETGDWLFDDGTATLSVPYVFNSAPSGAVIASGTISTASYASFFGLQDYSEIYGPGGGWAYLVFDIDSSVDPFSTDFSVTLNAVGSAGIPDHPNSPEPDVMGRIGVAPTGDPGSPVPAPGALCLVCLGVGAVGWLRRNRTF